jgi:hypothetical protein
MSAKHSRAGSAHAGGREPSDASSLVLVPDAAMTPPSAAAVGLLALYETQLGPAVLTATASFHALAAAHADLAYGPGLAEWLHAPAPTPALAASEVHARYVAGRPRLPPPWLARYAYTAEAIMAPRRLTGASLVTYTHTHNLSLARSLCRHSTVCIGS